MKVFNSVRNRLTLNRMISVVLVVTFLLLAYKETLMKSFLGDRNHQLPEPRPAPPEAILIHLGSHSSAKDERNCSKSHVFFFMCLS